MLIKSFTLPYKTYRLFNSIPLTIMMVLYLGITLYNMDKFELTNGMIIAGAAALIIGAHILHDNYD